MSDRDYWRDEGHRRSDFWVTYPATKAIVIGLAAIHVLMAFVRAAEPVVADDLQHLLALSPEQAIREFRVWQLLTCSLLHVRVWHLVSNCIGLLVFGRLVEQRLGTRKFLRFCLGAQLTASLAFLLLAAVQHTRMPMIGASGIDFGLVVLAAFWYPRLQIIYFLLSVPLWALATLYVFVEAMMLLEAGGGVAHSAHLGGALYGFLYYRWVGEFDQLFAFVRDWQRRRDRLRLEHERRARDALRGEVDRILDKVNREGMAALTEEERRVLKEASARLRR